MQDLIIAIFVIGLLVLAFWLIVQEDKRLRKENEEIRIFRRDLISVLDTISSALWRRD